MDKKTYDDTIAALTDTRIKATVSKEAATEYLIKSGLMDLEDMITELKEEEFPYMVAQLWEPNEPDLWENLKKYHYGNGQVLFGSMEDATGFLKYVQNQKEYDGTSYDNDPENNPWKIYKINFEEIVNG